MFKTLFKPATQFMNKLRFGYKFTLIVLLFFVPLIILATRYVSIVKKEIVHSENELQSIAYIKLVDQYQKELTELIASDMHWRAGQTIPAEQTARIKKFKNKLGKLADKNVFSGQDLEKVSAQVKLIEKTLIEKTSTIGSAVWRSPTDKINYLLTVMEQFNNLYPLIGNLKGLTNDPDIDTVLLSRLLIEKRIPTLKSFLSGYALATYAIGEPQVSSATFDSLSIASDELAAEIPKLNELNSLVADQDETLVSLVKGDVAVLNKIIEDSLMYLEEEFLIAEEILLTRDQIEQHISKELTRYFASKQLLFNEFESRLSARIEKNITNFYTLVALVTISLMLVIYLFIGMSLSISITTRSLTRVAKSLADGDTTVSAKVLTKDELAEALTAFNQMAKNVHHLVEAVQSASQGVTKQAQSVEELAHQTGQAVATQLEDTGVITNAIVELLQAVSVVSENSASVVHSLNSATDQTKQGKLILADARKATDVLGNEIKLSVEVINQLAQESESINDVLSVIKGIAEQTNLLALNAAIEAARAGEQGRGFAVVADEVRNLAKRTQDSTEEIQATIHNLQAGVQNAVQAMTRSDEQASRTIEESTKLEDALDHISISVEQISQQNVTTEEATHRQQAIAADIEKSLTSISNISQEADKNVKDSIQATNSLGKFVLKLESMLEKFKT